MATTEATQTLALCTGIGLVWRAGASEPTLPWVSTAASTRARRAPETPVAKDTLAEDAAWVARARAGDEDAARALIERLYPTILQTEDPAPQRRVFFNTPD